MYVRDTRVWEVGFKSFSEDRNIMLCEICGETMAEKKIFVEGTVLNVCEECSKFGSEIRKMPQPVRKVLAREEEVESIVADFARLVRSSREKLGLTQGQLGKKVNEKESVMVRIENGKMQPPISTAKKLESFLGIKLVEKESSAETSKKETAGKEEGVTLGDIVKIK